nr:hypothetical protein [Tanacetum cinerariifolium]
MHKAFPLPGESSHWQYKFPLPVEGVPTARRMEIPLPGVCTAMMKKLPNNIDDKGYWDSGCSRHMTGNISYLSEYEPYDGGYVLFGHGGEKIDLGEGSANPIEPHHTPSPHEQHSSHHDSLPPSHPTTTSEPLPQAPTETLTPTRYTRRAKQTAQSKALSPAADEPASHSRDNRQEEAFPTVSSLDAEQDRENIAKTSALLHESSPRVTSLNADEGNQDQEISELKARVKFLEDKESRSAEPTQEDAPIIGGIIEIREELGATKSIELGSNDIEEMVNVLSSMEATNILTSRGAPASVSPGDALLTVGVPTVSGSFPTISAIFTTTSVQLDREDLHQLWTLVKETFSIKQATSDKEKELWVELKRLFELDFEDQLWKYHQAFMHDPLDWKLYDTCGVHHVSTKDQEIFMLVEKDYPLRKGLATVMIILDVELIEASSPGEHLVLET